MELVLGVDVDTTATEAVCFDQDGSERGTGENGYPLSEPNPGAEVQDPRQVMAAADAAVAAATRPQASRSRASASARQCTR